MSQLSSSQNYRRTFPNTAVIWYYRTPLPCHSVSADTWLCVCVSCVWWVEKSFRCQLIWISSLNLLTSSKRRQRPSVAVVWSIWNPTSWDGNLLETRIWNMRSPFNDRNNTNYNQYCNYNSITCRRQCGCGMWRRVKHKLNQLCLKPRGLEKFALSNS